MLREQVPSRKLKEPGKGRDLVTIELQPEMRRAVNDALEQEPETDASKLFRRAFRFWRADAAQAMDAYEMWLLRASRASRAHNQQEWARKMRGLEVLLRGITEKAAMEAGLNASLIDLSGQDGEQSGSASDRPDVRKAANRRAPKAR